ncbi:MAG: hypothetical protein FVQ85_02050 [Planctomycetes bacterium]|nr:hypothetical protein [Planctomycetota bacterium]
MIKFHCKHCGQKIRVPEVGAGRKGKCPKCKNIVLVPKVEDILPVASQTGPIDSQIIPQATILNPSVFEDGPKETTAEETSTGGEVSGGSLGVMAGVLGGRAGYEVQEETPTRELPWFIDTFLYPISKAGLTTMGVIIGVPLAMSLFVFLLGLVMLAFPPMFVFVAFFGIIGWLIRIVVSLFAYWYFCECIRDSADGGIRAPETMATTPSIGEIFWQFMKLVGCFIFFWAPLTAYVYSAGAGGLFFLTGIEPVESEFSLSIAILLLAYAVFFFPMGLLSIVLFDSIAGLNPILIIGSILSTFFQYCGLILLFFAIGALSIISVAILPQFWLLRFFSNVTLLYMAMVYAHLLGRFYWRYQKKLNWEV